MHISYYIFHAKVTKDVPLKIQIGKFIILFCFKTVKAELSKKRSVDSKPLVSEKHQERLSL